MPTSRTGPASRRARGALVAGDLEPPSAPDLADVAVGKRGDAQRDVAADRAAKHRARARVGAVRADHVAIPARLALAWDGGHLGAEDLDEEPREAVPVEPERLLGHRPVGPKRSVRIAAGGWPSETRLSAACSTNAVGPQTKMRGFSDAAGPTSASIAAST